MYLEYIKTKKLYLLYLIRMDFEDFLDNFDSLDICNLTPDSPVDVQRKWVSVEHNGRWMKHFNAGGRPSCPGELFNCFYRYLDCIFSSLVKFQLSVFFLFFFFNNMFLISIAFSPLG